MTIFEPLFLLLALVTLVSLLTALVRLARGQAARAGRIVLRVAVGALVYFVAVAAVSIVTPRRVHRIGEAQCFDDWCITVADVQRTPVSSGGSVYDIGMKLSSRARRVPMGEKGTVVYLTDGQGRRYDPLPDPSGVPLDTILQPGESVIARRRFDVPADAQNVGLVYTHEGGFPIWWLIVGEGGWFRKPPIVRLD